MYNIKRERERERERPVMSRLAISITSNSIKDIVEGLFPVELDLAIKKKHIEEKLCHETLSLYMETDACA